MALLDFFFSLGLHLLGGALIVFTAHVVAGWLLHFAESRHLTRQTLVSLVLLLAMVAFFMGWMPSFALFLVALFCLALVYIFIDEVVLQPKHDDQEQEKRKNDETSSYRRRAMILTVSVRQGKAEATGPEGYDRRLEDGDGFDDTEPNISFPQRKNL